MSNPEEEPEGAGADVAPTWKEAFFEFTQNTTFHGFRYITETTPYFLRRILWFFIVGGVSSGFAFIIYHRINKYLLYDQSVNVDIVYEDEVKFPGVTICNQNFLRATKVYDAGIYDIVSSYFSDNKYGILDEEDYCRHQYVGEVSVAMAEYSNSTKYFTNLTLDSCRRLCSDLKSFYQGYWCIAFEYNRNTRICTLLSNETETPLRTVRRTGSGIFTKRKPCIIQQEDIDGRYAVIGHGILIPLDDRIEWEEKDFHNAIGPFRQWLLEEGGHQAGDLIHTCKWKGKKCDKTWFRQQMTDYGVCYTFTDRLEERITTQTGSTFGLRLTINVEEYEYMPGPNSDAGIKMYLHPMLEIPMVRDLGFAVPPGRHSLISVKLTNLSNLEPPWGKCGSIKLQFFKSYTWFRCKRNCEIKMVTEYCDCIAPYMKSNEDVDFEICNMTHYFRCGIPAIQGKSDIDGGGKSCPDCIPPCKRDIYEPQTSNAALSTLSIETILATKTEYISRVRAKARDLKYRVTEQYFLATAKDLVESGNAFEHFLKKAEKNTKDFQQDLIEPVIATLDRLITIFYNDMNYVLFEGLDETMTEMRTIFGPSKDSIYFFMQRVIRNSKLVSVHVQSLVRMNYLYPGLEELMDQTISYAKVAEDNIPTYYDMVTNVPKTMSTLGYNYSSLEFPPLKLAKQSEECEIDIGQLVNHTKYLSRFIGYIQEDVEIFQKTQDASSLNLKSTLKYLYETIIEIQTELDETAAVCFEPFTLNVTQIHELNETYLGEVEVHTDLEYTFDFEEEAKEVFDDMNKIRSYGTQYLQEGNITKQQLQDGLHEELLNDMISRQRAFITKVKFRLIERLTRRMDKARADITDWYLKMLKTSDAVSEYMPHLFMENRASNMTIWHSPRAVVYDQAQYGTLLETFNFDLSNWTMQDYFSAKSLDMVGDIIDYFFEPINDAISKTDDDLSEMEQDLTFALKSLRDLINDYDARDKLDEKYVLKNFLQVDVYYSELRMQRIMQRPAYVLGDFWGDVGGYMGLLLGASIVTLFEFLDVLIYNCLRKTICRKKPEEPESITSNTSEAGIISDTPAIPVRTNIYDQASSKHGFFKYS